MTDQETQRWLDYGQGIAGFNDLRDAPPSTKTSVSVQQPQNPWECEPLRTPWDDVINVACALLCLFLLVFLLALSAGFVMEYMT